MAAKEAKKLEFPTMEQVEHASHEDLARWYRFLCAENKQQQEVLDAVRKRFQQLGGMTPDMSRRIGYGGV